MRSEKGITLVALIGIFVLIVILAGISIAIAAKGNGDVQEPANRVVTNLEDEEYDDEELVVDPTAGTTTDDDARNTVVEDVNTANENVVDEDKANTATNEVE